jgi:Tfp pilus assembly protein PilV
MQFSKKATSLIEAIIIMTIVSFGVIWLYDFYISSEKLASTTNKRIKAIQISREWLEGVTNIRNTNWLLYGADYQNCWNVQSYRIECIGNSTFTYDIRPWSYIISQNTENRWHLDWIIAPFWAYPDLIYRNEFWVEIASDGFYNQQTTPAFINPPYTREIIISYPEDTNSDGNSDSNDDKMHIKSLVQWGTSGTHRVELSHTLTNWKNKN